MVRLNMIQKMIMLCMVIVLNIFKVVYMQAPIPPKAYPQVLSIIGKEHLWLTCPHGYIFKSTTTPMLTCGIRQWTGNTQQCDVCPSGTYKVNDVLCTRCPPNSHTAGPANSVSDCICQKGYHQRRGECVDIDECAANGGRGPCDQKCRNTIGGYECSCRTGYSIDPENSDRCKAEKKCKALGRDDAPENGGLVCYISPDKFLHFCAPRCNSGYEFASRINNYEVCGPKTDFIWTFRKDDPQNKIQPCIKQFFPGLHLEAKIKYFTNKCSDASDKEVKKQLKSLLDLLNSNGECSPETCKPENAKIVCGPKKLP